MVTPREGGECCGAGTAALWHGPAQRAGRNVGSAPQPRCLPSPGALESFVRRQLAEALLGLELEWRVESQHQLCPPPGRDVSSHMDNHPLKGGSVPAEQGRHIPVMGWKISFLWWKILLQPVWTEATV